MERPDFILLKEALLAYEKIMIHKTNISKNLDAASTINEEDKKYFFTLLSVVVNTFGTEDTEWFCATETILNTLFNVKTRNQPEYAKSIIQQLSHKLYSDGKKNQQIIIDEEQKVLDDEASEIEGGTPLRTDITDMHYAQLFFAVGHIAIKMLTYVEHIDSELKKSGSSAGNEAYQ